MDESSYTKVERELHIHCCDADDYLELETTSTAKRAHLLRLSEKPGVTVLRHDVDPFHLVMRMPKSALRLPVVMSEESRARRSAAARARGFGAKAGA